MIIDPYTWHDVKIMTIIREADQAVSLRLSMPDDYTFLPGQHAILRVTLPDNTSLMRQYSFASTPLSGEAWLSIVQTPGGQVSTWLVKNAHVGDKLQLSQPFAGPLQVEAITQPDRLCLIAGGSGIAPLMSILRHRRACKLYQTSLIYSTRTNQQCYQQELRTIHPDEQITIRNTTNQARLNQHDIENICKRGKVVLVCGSRQFVNEIETMCSKLKPKPKLYSEAFSLE